MGARGIRGNAIVVAEERGPPARDPDVRVKRRVGHPHIREEGDSIIVRLRIIDVQELPSSTSNVWPQSRDRVISIWSLWKSSQATYPSPPGPTATVAPWFCEFGEWLSEMIGVQLRPPSEERWSTIFVPWLPSKKAHGMYTFPSQVPPVSSTAIHSLSVTREFPGPPSLSLEVSWPAKTTDVKSYVAPKFEYRVRTSQPANSVVVGPNESHARYTRPSRSVVITGSLPIFHPASFTGDESPSGEVSPGKPGTRAFFHVSPPSVDR